MIFIKNKEKLLIFLFLCYYYNSDNMKKKGFTLVELLAVIAILAILVIIALPNVMGMFNGAKERSFVIEAQKILRGAEQSYINDMQFSSGVKKYSKCASGCSNEVNMSVRDDLNYYIEVSSQGRIVKYYIYDNSYQYSYEGEQLKADDIKTVQNVSDVQESEKITIANSTPFIGGSAVVEKKKLTIKYTGIELYYEEGMTWGTWLNSSYNSEIEFVEDNITFSTEFNGVVNNNILEDGAQGISTGTQNWYCAPQHYLTSHNLLYNETLEKFVTPNDVISNTYNYSAATHAC